MRGPSSHTKGLDPNELLTNQKRASYDSFLTIGSLFVVHKYNKTASVPPPVLPAGSPGNRFLPLDPRWASRSPTTPVRRASRNVRTKGELARIRSKEVEKYYPCDFKGTQYYPPPPLSTSSPAPHQNPPTLLRTELLRYFFIVFSMPTNEGRLPAELLPYFLKFPSIPIGTWRVDPR